MEKQELLKQFAKPEDKLLVSKIYDKIKFTHNRNQIQTTSFLDGYEQTVVEKFLKLCQEKNFLLEGGFPEAERKMLFLFPDKLENLLSKNATLQEAQKIEVELKIEEVPEIEKTQNKALAIVKKFIKVISIILPKELQGTYHHREYLGGLMKLGIEREKIGDIIVNEQGADILVQSEITSFFLSHLPDLTRFQKAQISQKEITELKIEQIKKESMVILVPQLRLDVVLSEILHLSRSKASDFIEQERVFVNYELKTKNATTLKQGDILTVRGKGKYEIGEILSQTAKGKLRLEVKKYVS